jgi:hypothetical protein
LSRLSHGVISLNEPEGGLWHGKGYLVVRSDMATPHALGQLEWTIDPLWLLGARIEARLHLVGPDMDTHGSVHASYNLMRVHDLAGHLSPRMLAVFYPPVSLFEPVGRFQVTSGSLQLDAAGLQGGMQVLWQDAGLNLSDVRPLGDYKLYLEGAGKQARLSIETIKGSLSISGSGEMNLDSREYRFTGDMVPTARAAELEPILRMLGNDVGGGKRTFSLAGRSLI